VARCPSDYSPPPRGGKKKDSKKKKWREFGNFLPNSKTEGILLDGKKAVKGEKKVRFCESRVVERGGKRKNQRKRERGE